MEFTPDDPSSAVSPRVLAAVREDEGLEPSALIHIHLAGPDGAELVATAFAIHLCAGNGPVFHHWYDGLDGIRVRLPPFDGSWLDVSDGPRLRRRFKETEVRRMLLLYGTVDVAVSYEIPENARRAVELGETLAVRLSENGLLESLERIQRLIACRDV